MKLELLLDDDCVENNSLLKQMWRILHQRRYQKRQQEVIQTSPIVHCVTPYADRERRESQGDDNSVPLRAALLLSNI